MTESEIRAAAVLRQCRDVMAARGSSPLAEATAGAAVADWRHYPDGEVYDPASHAQYFYHRHAGERGEHGHFHLFLRGDGVPEGIAPLLLPELAVANAPVAPPSAPARRGNRDEVCHLVAIGLDARGEPMRLFTTNRWVTGETWYRAEDAVLLLDRFAVQSGGSSPMLDRYLVALVRLYRTDIAGLLQQRDKAVLDWRWRWPRRNAFEDTRLEVTSSLDIDLAGRLAAVEANAVQPAPARRPAARLPRMAEGWGA